MKLFVLLFIFLFSCSGSSIAKKLTVILPSYEDGPSVNARLFIPYMIQNLPEIVSIEYKVVPGAATINAANYLFDVATKDGYTIGIFNRNVPFMAYVGDTNIKFDPSLFTWLGSVADGRLDPILLFSHKKEIKDLIVGTDIVSIGNPAFAVNKIGNFNFKIITGYKNNTDIRVAFQRKEIDGFFNALVGMRTTGRTILNDNNVFVLLQFGNGRHRHSDYMNVPTLSELYSDSSIQYLESQSWILRPFVAPPNIPEEMKSRLRDAFDKAVKDKQYIEQAKNIGVDVNQISYREIYSILDYMKTITPDVVQKLK
jgi:tripartite-type tricarboxylate transporter receptor subunit TctC